MATGPPHFLFDVAYGCAALKTWGVREFVQFAEEQANEAYYHDVDYGEDGEKSDDNDKHPNDDKDATTAASVRGKQTVRPEKANHHSRTETPATGQAKAGDSQAVDNFDVVVGLWVHNARKDMRRARIMKEGQMRESV